MTIAVARNYIAEGGGASTLAKASVVVNSGDGLVVLVLASDATSPSAPTITGVTWNATSLTEFGNALTSGDDGNGARHRFAVYYLATPTPGTQTVTASFGSSPLIAAMEVVVVNGHDTSTMMRASSFATAYGGATTMTIDITSAATDLVLDFARARNGGGGGVSAHGPGSNQTQLDEATSSVGSSWSFHSSYEVATGATTTMSWTTAPDSAWSTTGAAVREAAGGGGSSSGAAAYYYAQQ